jgi:hypothetical protein
MLWADLKSMESHQICNNISLPKIILTELIKSYYALNTSKNGVRKNFRRRRGTNSSQMNRKGLHLVAEPATYIGLLILWNVGLELSINILK